MDSEAEKQKCEAMKTRALDFCEILCYFMSMLLHQILSVCRLFFRRPEG
jgi:hypothetical protein